MKVGLFSGLQARSADRRSCGSAFFLGVMDGKGFVCSNAHVWGTSVNSACHVVGVRDDGSVVEKSGRLRWAAFREGAAIDWAIAELSVQDYLALPGASESQQLRDLDPSAAIGYVGGPRCELPSFRRVKFVKVSGGIAYGSPAAIGGMSGGAWQHDGAPCGITTWTDGTHNMAQHGAALRATMRPEFFASLRGPSDPEPECPCEREAQRASSDGWLRSDFDLPSDARVACDVPQPCGDGFFGEVSGLLPVDVLDNALHPARVRGLVGFESIDWLEILRLLLPLLLEWLKRK